VICSSSELLFFLLRFSSISEPFRGRVSTHAKVLPVSGVFKAGFDEQRSGLGEWRLCGVLSSAIEKQGRDIVLASTAIVCYMGSMSKERRTLSSLFKNGPPTTPEEVKRLVSQMNQRQARTDFLELIEKDAFVHPHFVLFTEVAQILEIPVHCVDRLAAMATSPSLSFMARQFAVVAMTAGSPSEEVRDVIESLDPHLLVAAAEMPIVAVMTNIQVDPSSAAEVTGMLLTVPPDAREHVLSHLCRIRRTVGTSAALAYADALSNPALAALHPAMLRALIEEARTEGVTLLEVLRDKAPDDETRQRFQRALLFAGTRRLERSPSLRLARTRVLVSNCDGQGAFFLLARFPVSKTCTTTANCCIRVSQEIRDAYVLPAQSDEDFERMLTKMRLSRQVALAEIPAEQGATLFAEGLDRTREQGDALSDSARSVLDLFEQLKNHGIDEQTAAASVSRAALERLLTRRCYDSWFFDEGDIAGNGVPLPEDVVEERWSGQAAARLGATPVKERLLAMLRHMARWHRWNGEAAAADLLTAAREEAKREFETSAVVRLILKKSYGVFKGTLRPFRQDDELRWKKLEDDSLRAVLRRTFFSHLKRPQGRHLEALDFTEITYQHLSLAFAALPGEKRPKEDTVLDLSHKVADAFVRATNNGLDKSSALSSLKKYMSQTMPLSPAEIDHILGRVSEGIAKFVDFTCRHCPLRCMDHPRKGMADAFFSQHLYNIFQKE
jgi:hypothetical protein